MIQDKPIRKNSNVNGGREKTRPLSGRLQKALKLLLPYLLILPTFAFVGTFTFWPTINAAILSTFSPPLTAKDKTVFVGLQNYRDLFDQNTIIGREDRFPRVMENTLLFVAVTVPVRVILGFLLAVLLNISIRGTVLYRSAVFYPVLLPGIGAAALWAYMFADNFGLINYLLHFAKLPSIGWTRDALWALPAIMIVVIWNSSGYTMIFYLAGMQQISNELYEAAQLDGASAFQRMRYITIPLVSGTTLFILITTGIGAFLSAEPQFVLGRGGPNNHSNMILYFIIQRFIVPGNFGYANALTILLLGMLLVFTAFNFIVIERRAHYE